MNVVPRLIFHGQAGYDPQAAAAALAGATLSEAASNLALLQTALQLQEESDDRLIALAAVIENFTKALNQNDSNAAEEYREAIANQIRALKSPLWQKALGRPQLFGDKNKVVAQLTARLRKDWEKARSSLVV